MRRHLSYVAKCPEGVGVSEFNEREHKWTLNTESNIREKLHRQHLIDSDNKQYKAKKQAFIETSEKILAVTLVIGIMGAFLWLCALGIGHLLRGTL